MQKVAAACATHKRQRKKTQICKRILYCRKNKRCAILKTRWLYSLPGACIGQAVRNQKERDKGLESKKPKGKNAKSQKARKQKP
ncbi:hypothetical protein DXA97_06105 [Clostridium sp. OF09-36]|nr:hypothetical protein DXA97_06105 [Clostridium sp. OF09-36]